MYYKPSDAWAGDFIPFYWQGVYHLFYLKDYRDPKNRGRGTPWFHISTTDFVHFTEHGEALARGRETEQDLYVYTGCVLEHNGCFHIYYTGHNPDFPKQGKPRQAIMHATSPDLMRWEKDKHNPVLYADETRYERDDWRDPFVFWNEEKNEFWMLLAARLRKGPEHRRGCIALATSTDLKDWEVQDPFWAPSLYYTHECPDLFRLGDWWYLVYSEFSEQTVTRYRRSRSLNGPWLPARDDALDTRAFYAAKTASDGRRRFIFGWNPTRQGDSDLGDWQWGGNLIVHELKANHAGELSTGLPATILDYFGPEGTPSLHPQSGNWRIIHNQEASVSAPDSLAVCALGDTPAEPCLLELNLSFMEGTRALGVLLRTDERLEHYYQVRIEPARSRLVFDRWPRPGDQPFMLERPAFSLVPGSPHEMRIIIDGSLIEVYLDGKTTLSARGYDRTSSRGAALFVSDGSANFSKILFHRLIHPPSTQRISP